MPLNHVFPFLQRKLLYFGICLLTILCLGCKTQQISPDKYAGYQIRFGQGGGFTGLKTEYAILENGHYFKQAAGKDTFEYVNRFEKQFVDQMIKNIDFLKLDKMNINHPCDLYFFIELKEGPDSKRLVWGKSDVETAESLKAFYRILYSSVKNDLK